MVHKNKITDRELRTGYTYTEAKKVAEKSTKLGRNSRLRVTWGTSTRKFHFILPNDRDYKHFSLSLGEFLRTPNKELAKDYILRPTIWRG
jgi:hypothetical protein